jgi:dTMP kinase
MFEPGKLIPLEGSDGQGKSKQAELIVERLNSYGIEAITLTEPGGTPIGAELRPVIKNEDLQRDPLTNVLLFTADRRELYLQKIKPALESGVWVIPDRYWYSTYVYQGHGEGVDTDFIEEFTRKYVGEEYANPDMAILLSLTDEEERRKRVRASADTANDIFENKGPEFQQRLGEGYKELVTKFGATAIYFTREQGVEEVHEMVWEKIEPLTR